MFPKTLQNQIAEIYFSYCFTVFSGALLPMASLQDGRQLPWTTLLEGVTL